MPLLLYPLATEKAHSLIDKQNKIVFVVELSATKLGIRRAIEAEFGEKVRSVRTLIGADGSKRAIITFARTGAARELAARLKLL